MVHTKNSSKRQSLLFYKQAFLYVLPFIVLLLAYIFFYKIYVPRVTAFGCFDDCFNIVGGYWVTQGKVIYRDFFFNHHPGMAILSAGIQMVTSPINIYELILRHRQFVLLFGFVMYLPLIFRFRWPVIGFMLIYETTKFYLFGDRFLAEGIIVYPLLYLVGLVMYKWQKKPLFLLDYLFAAVCTWFVLFMREPYNPLALFLFFLVTWGSLRLRASQWAFVVFGLLTGITLLFLPLPDFIFNVFTINSQMFRGEVQQGGAVSVLHAFVYPFTLYSGGVWNILRVILVGVTTLFLGAMVMTWLQGKKALVILIFLILGLGNLRFTPPGYVFYEAFHMLPWYAMLLFSTWMLVKGLGKRVQLVLVTILLGIYGYFLMSPDTYLRDQPDQHASYLTQYGGYASYGEAVRLLSTTGDTVFVDGFDELIHWQAKLPSSYRYNWYTSVMPQIPRYASERSNMFTQNPPTFYYGSCPGNKVVYQLLPVAIKVQYQQVSIFGKPSCLYVYKKKLPSITPEQWQTVKEIGYELANEE